MVHAVDQSTGCAMVLPYTGKARAVVVTVS